MDRLLLGYLPTVLRGVPEFKALMAAEQPEFEALWAAHDDALENQFLGTATDYGIRRWEHMLRIFPKDTDGLEMRRARVLSILRLKLPYTVRWLRNWLDELCGPGNYRLAIADYTIHLDLGFDGIPEAEKLAGDILSLLLTVKPASMLLDFNAMRQSTGDVVVGGLTEYGIELDVWPARSELTSSGWLQVKSITEYVSAIEIYPLT